MQFLIANTFSDALAKLQPQEQKAVKITVFDLQQNPSAPGLRFHRIDRSRDPDFWSIRAGRDLRIVVHKTAASFLVCYVDHHDNAYRWAERRRIETHPRTGAAQIVEVRERVEEIAPSIATPAATPSAGAPQDGLSLFGGLTGDELLDIGVPEDWIDDVRGASEERFFAIAERLPDEAAEALLEFATTGVLAAPVSVETKAAEVAVPAAAPGEARLAASFAHPDAQRRFRIMDDREELERALDYPWDRWMLYLHPAQRRVAERSFNGPARVAGSAGTGKTVVALHRAARLVRADPQARVLLTTFSDPLANTLAHKLHMLLRDDAALRRTTVLSSRSVAKELFTLMHGHEPQVAGDRHVDAALEAAIAETEVSGFSKRFVRSEWTHVVDAWQIVDLESFASVPRLGRRQRLGAKQRERLWPVFESMRTGLAAQHRLTWPMAFSEVTGHYRDNPDKPFTHVVVDEAQDLGVPELRMLAAIAEEGTDRLFFSGDLGQRIFQEPFSWKALGIDVRGRSTTLKVNYRTSHQIREALDRLLPPTVRDVDGMEESRKGTVSVFNGPMPTVRLFGDKDAEATAVAVFLGQARETGAAPEEIGIFVRDRSRLDRARRAASAAGVEWLELSERVETAEGKVRIGTMHLAKGLEFKAVAVMACDDGVVPLQSRIETVADEAELNEVFETERHLLYVACTRARDRLLVTGLRPGSEFLEDLELPIV